MSDLSSYRQQVTQYGQRAQEAENGERYEEAYGHYMAALDVFMHLIKCKFTCNRATLTHWLIVLFISILVEKNPQLVKLYKEKMGQYLQRAEYIKKTVLDVPDTPAGGGAAQAQKPAGSGQEEDNKEEEKM